MRSSTVLGLSFALPKKMHNLHIYIKKMVTNVFFVSCVFCIPPPPSPLFTFYRHISVYLIDEKGWNIFFNTETKVGILVEIEAPQRVIRDKFTNEGPVLRLPVFSGEISDCHFVLDPVFLRTQGWPLELQKQEEQLCPSDLHSSAKPKLKHLRLYLRWSSYTLYLPTCQVGVTIGNSGLCCCVCMTSFKHYLTMLVQNSSDHYLP